MIGNGAYKRFINCTFIGVFDMIAEYGLCWLSCLYLTDRQRARVVRRDLVIFFCIFFFFNSLDFHIDYKMGIAIGVRTFILYLLFVDYSVLSITLETCRRT